jgi:Na+-translocating ferredoxin:NAD+ oxidoreductase RnfE subunit
MVVMAAGALVVGMAAALVTLTFVMLTPYESPDYFPPLILASAIVVGSGILRLCKRPSVPWEPLLLGIAEIAGVLLVLLLTTAIGQVYNEGLIYVALYTALTTWHVSLVVPFCSVALLKFGVRFRA